MSAGVTSPAASAVESERKVLFEPFSWNKDVRGLRMEAQPVAEFVGAAYDVAAGVSTLLQMLERDHIDGELIGNDAHVLPALLSVNQRGRLMRLSVVTLDMLSARAERMLDTINALVSRSQGGAA